MPTARLRPEPIPLSVKVVLIGPLSLYHSLMQRDGDFQELFSVEADFDEEMEWSDEHLHDYVAYVSRQIRERDLKPFDRAAVARVIEYGARLREDQRKLSTRLLDISKVVTEANYWAGTAGRETVLADDVDQAIRKYEYRSNLVEERMRELLTEGTIAIGMVTAVHGGRSEAEVARLFGVSRRSIGRYVSREAATGYVTPRRPSGTSPTDSGRGAGWLTAQLRAHPVATLERHCHVWTETTGVWVSATTMYRAITRLVFVAESSANVTLTPRYGRAPIGERAPASAPRNYRHNTTVVAALTAAGIQTPMTVEGAMDGDAFAASVARFLVPHLRPGQIVILDTLSVHKHADIRQQIEAPAGALIFLPAYSRDGNPIEQAFSKLNAWLRHTEARIQETLEAAIAQALTTITRADAAAWFHHCQYHLAGQSL